MIRPYHPAHRPAGSTGSALLGLAICSWLAWYGVHAVQPPPAECESAPDREFSASRAMATVERLAEGPRPVGSARHRKAVELVATELERRGLVVRIREYFAVRHSGGDTVVAATLRNIVARRPATAGGGGSGSLLLVAHVDTRPTTPGAGDDASGVGIVLEVARALGDSATTRDLVVLVSDGEELGLLGATEFAEEDPWFDGVGSVVNVEARGNRGPSILFETGPGDARLVAVAAETPHPFGTSFAREVYRRLPNDTDFSVFRERGLPGLNFAFIGGIQAYHTSLDTADALSRRSLQHQGETVLGVARRVLTDRDPVRSERDAVYFSLPGWTLVTLSARSLLFVGIAALIGALLTIWWARSRRMLNYRGLAVGVALPPVLAVTVAGVAWAAWRILSWAVPDLVSAPHGVPWNEGWIGLGAGLLGLAAASVVAALAARLGSPFALQAGALAAWTILGAVAAATVPGAGYLLVVPAVAGVAGFAVVVARRADFESPGTVLGMLTLLGATAALLSGPVVALTYEALTVHGIAAVGAITGFVLSALVLHLVLFGRAIVPPALAAVAGVSVLVVVGWQGVDGPISDSLSFVERPAAGEATWVSLEDPPGPRSARILGDDAALRDLEAEIGLPAEGRVAEAEPVSLPPPVIAVNRDQRASGGRQVELRLESRRNAPVLRLALLSESTVRIVAVEGRPVEVGPEGAKRLVVYGPPPGGVEVVVQIAGDVPVTAHLLDQSWDLPPLPDGESEDGPEIVPSSSWWAESTFVHAERTM